MPEKHPWEDLWGGSTVDVTNMRPSVSEDGFTSDPGSKEVPGEDGRRAMRQPGVGPACLRLLRLRRTGR